MPNLGLGCNSVSLNMNFKVNESFELLKFEGNVSSKGLDQLKNENMFIQIILDKLLSTNSRNYVKEVFLSSVLTLFLQFSCTTFKN